ncbi:MAG: permease [Pseudomonadota bacterium]
MPRNAPKHFAALSPFCSCGVVPIVAGLLAAGVPLAPVMAFLIASPIMDPEMFILTGATLGWEFALWKAISAAGMGWLSGYGTLVLLCGVNTDNLLHDIARPSCASPKCGESAQTQQKKWLFWQDGQSRRDFINHSRTNSWFLGRWLTFAFLLESLMVAFVPAETISSLLGAGNAWAIPLATALGMPAYMNGYTGIPLIRGMIDLGMSPATGLAFMMAGGVTSIPAAIAVWSLIKPHLFLLYLLFGAFGAMAFAVIFQTWLGLS